MHHTSDDRQAKREWMPCWSDIRKNLMQNVTGPNLRLVARAWSIVLCIAPPDMSPCGTLGRGYA